MYQLIIFDWDGTLMDSAQKIANCIKAAAREIGLEEPGDQQAKNIIGLGLAEAMHILFPKLSEAQNRKLVDAYRHQFVVADQTQQGLFQGVEQGLQALAESGALLAVATGKARAGMQRVFAEIDLEHLFVASRCADETRSKPHPQMLLELLDYTAIDPKNTIMVGDTTFDMDMAKNAGVHGLGAAYGVHDETALRAAQAVEVLHSFLDIQHWLLNQRTQAADA